MIDINKKYRTRDGREVRIYAIDGHESFPVHGAIKMDGQWRVSTWNSSGNGITSSKGDRLTEVPPRHKQTVWLNVYGPESYTSHHSRQQADDERDRKCLACIKVELDFEEGEGL